MTLPRPELILQPLPGERVITDLMREQMMFDSTIVRTLFEELSQEWGDLQKYRDYYDGDQPLVYGTEKFKEFFPNFEGFEDNWCAPVIDAMADKIELIGIDVDEEKEDDEDKTDVHSPIAERIWNVFRDNNIKEQSADLVEGVFVEGRAAVIVWPDESIGARIDWNPAQLVKVRYSEEDYRKIDFAVKRWVTPSGQINLNIYDKNEVRKYYQTPEPPSTEANRGSSPAKSIPNTAPSPGLNFRFIDGEEWPLSHSFGEVPVVEFPNKRGSELSDVVPLQDGINYLLIASFLASEFSALRQRVFLTHLKEPEGGWKSSPGQVWHLTPALDSDGKYTHGETREFQAADLSQYRQLIEMVLQHLALTSKTPVRMFFKSDRGGRGDSPSGDSQLIEDEPLLDKVEDRVNRLDSKWFQVVQLVAKAIGVTSPIRGHMVWKDPKSKYRAALLDEAVKLANEARGLGLPLKWVVTRLGLAPTELEELLDILEEEEAKAEKEQRELANQSNQPPQPPVSEDSGEDED